MAVVKMTPDGADYQDHELIFDKFNNLWMCFQDESNNGYVARVDPETGLFLDSNDGKDYQFATAITAIPISGKGPSLVINSADEWVVVYNKIGTTFQRIREATPTLDANGIPTGWSTIILTADDADRITVLPVNDPTLAAYRLVFRGTDYGFIKRSDPTTDNLITPTMSGSQRAGFNDRYMVTVSNAVPREIYLTDTDDNTTTRVTDDGQNKFDPYSMTAADYDGDTLVMGMIGQQTVRVYRQDTPFYSQLVDIVADDDIIPGLANSSKYAQSPEFFTDGDGKTWVIMTWKSSIDPILDVDTSEIWAHDLLGNKVRVSPHEPGVVTHEGEARNVLGRTHIWYQRVDPASGDIQIWVRTNALEQEFLPARRSIRRPVKSVMRDVVPL